MSIQYTVLGIKPMTFQKWASSHNHETRAPAPYIVLHRPISFSFWVQQSIFIIGTFYITKRLTAMTLNLLSHSLKAPYVFILILRKQMNPFTAKQSFLRQLKIVPTKTGVFQDRFSILGFRFHI